MLVGGLQSQCRRDSKVMNRNGYCAIGAYGRRGGENQALKTRYQGSREGGWEKRTKGRGRKEGTGTREQRPRTWSYWGFNDRHRGLPQQER